MSRIPPAKALAAAVLLLAGLIAGPASAEDKPYPDRWMLRLGGYNVSDADTIVRLDANSAPAGLYIDFAQTLGGQTSANVGRLDGYFRFNDRHSLGFSWYSLHFNGYRTLQKDIDWGDINFPIGADVSSEIKFNVYKLSYQYSLINNAEVELGGLIGLHVMDTSISLSSTGLVAQARADSVTAPLPVLGLYARYNFTPKLSIYYNYQFFFINYQDQVKGGLQDFLLGLEYRVWRNVALGAALNKFSMSIEDREDNATLYVDTNWRGAMLYGALYF
jgi:hypothetical protein